MATTTTTTTMPTPATTTSAETEKPPPLVSKLTTVKNARDLASAAPDLLCEGLLFRSACPAGCADEDVSLLRAGIGVRTLLDLRSDDERRQDPRCLLLHERGADVRSFDRLAGVGAAPSSSAAAASSPSSSFSSVVARGEEAAEGATATAAEDSTATTSSSSASSSSSSSSLFSLSGLLDRLLGRGKHEKKKKKKESHPLHSPTLPLPHIPADDPAPPADAAEPPLVVRHISLLDKRRFRKALIGEMPRASAAVVVALGLVGRVFPSRLGGALASDASRRFAMSKINKGGLENMYVCVLESSDAEIGAALRAILESLERRAPVLFFCRAGKDRTGLVAALVLSVCGVDEGRILDDYVLSDDPRASSVALGGLERSRDLQGLDTSVFARAPREAMERALARLRQKMKVEGEGQGEGVSSSSSASSLSSPLSAAVAKYLDERAGFSLAEQARLRAALAPPGKRPTPSL